MKTYPHPDGSYQKYPHTKELSRIRRLNFYTAPEACPTCGNRDRYVVSDKCVACAHDEALVFYRLGLHAKTPEQSTDGFYITHRPCRRSGHVGLRRVSTGRCAVCEEERSPRQKALAAGETWYEPADACPRCETRALRNVHNGRCKGCEPPKRSESPRQRALRIGETWYDPEENCPRCGQHAPRNVHTGRCQGCAPLRQRPRYLTPRQEALRAGRTWYEPDTPCRHCGGLALRNVHNGRCQGCAPLKRS